MKNSTKTNRTKSSLEALLKLLAKSRSIHKSLVTTDPTDIKRIEREYYKRYANEFDNLDKTSLKKHNLPKLIR